jgi:hypothetical protein
MLIQNGQEQFEGEWDKLNVTLHHNYFAGGDTRNPRIGFSDALILNNYWNGCGGYGIHIHWECKLLIERNYFKNVGDKISVHRAGRKKTPKWGRIWEGWAVLEDNIPKSGYGVKSQTDSSRIFNPDKVYMYDFIVDDVNSVPDIVSKGAMTGTQWSKLGAIPTPGQGLVNTSKNPMLKWTKYGSKPTNKVYFGKTEDPPEVATVDGYEYHPGMLEANTVYYWRINDGKLWKFRTGTEVDPNNPTANIRRITKNGSAIKPYVVNSGSGLMLFNPTSSKLSFTAYTVKGQSVLPLTVIEAGKRLRLPLVSSPLYIKIRGFKVRADGYLYTPVK